MRIRIGVCDDEIIYCKGIQKLLMRWEQKNENVHFTIFSFQNAAELIEEHKRSPFQVIFMDIQMPKINGLKAGELIRLNDKEVLLIYITGFKDYALKAFHVSAFEYILKPVTSKNIDKTMTKVLSRLVEKEILNAPTRLNTKSGFKTIDMNKVLYFQKDGHKIKCVFQHKEESYYCSLKSMKAQINMDEFIECNQGTLVKTSAIKELKQDEILLYTNHSLFLSRRHRKQAKKKFFDAIWKR